MLNRWRLPPDDFPDETETNAFQNYREDRGRVGEILSLIFGSRQRLLAAIVVIGLLVGAIWVGLYFLLPEPSPKVVIVPSDNGNGDEVVSDDPLPTTVVAEVVSGEFPTDVAQQLITVPARIDDSLAIGTRRGYTFYAEAGVTWEITVFGATGFDPVISLYGPPGGRLLDSNDDRAVGDLASELRVTIQQDGNYAVMIEGAGGVSGGGYTLLIVPVQ